MGPKDKNSGKSSRVTTKPQSAGSSADSPGEATPPYQETNKNESEISSILTPNVHLGITAALVAVLFGQILVSWSTSFSGGTVIVCPTLKKIESDCRKKHDDVIQCITDKLEPKGTSQDTWLSEIKAVYGSSEDFRGSLQRLRAIHAYMKDKNIKFPDIKEKVDALDTQVSDLVEWKRTIDANEAQMRVDANKARVDLVNFKVERDIFRSETNTTFTKVWSAITNLQKGKPQEEKPDTSSWSEKLDEFSKNMLALGGNLSTFKRETEQKFHGHYSQLKDIQNVKLPKMQNDININTKGIKVLRDDFESNKKETGDTLQRHEASLQEIIEDLEIVKTNVSTLQKDMENLEIKVDKNKKETENDIANIVNDRLPDIQKGVDDAMKKAGENEDALQNHKDLAERRQDEYNKYRQEIKETQGNTQFKQSVSQELIDEMRNKMVLHDASFYMGLLSIGCCVLMFMNMIKNYKSSGRTSEFRPTADKQIRPRENKDIFHLKWHGRKENSVCVVTFHSETERQHIAETKSVFESVGHTLPKIHGRVIRRHTDIQDLPGSRIFLIFVDFNERNVILEDPAKGLGDLRVTTVRSLWNFGGDVAVIYCKDHGSRSLGTDLFNRDLASIYSQTELSQLKNQQRMLSIFEEFSDAQKQHCREFINRQLNGN